MPSCGCIYVDNHDYDGPEFINEEIRKAKKAHKCGECNRKINPGEKYEYVFGVWGEDRETYKTCNDCLSIREEFFCNGWLYGTVIDEVVEHLWEYHGQISSECILRLTPKAKEFVINEIDKVFDRLNDIDEEDQ